MAEQRSALASVLRPGRLGAGAGEPGVVLAEAPIGALIQVSGWRDSFKQAVGALLQRLGFSGVGSFDTAGQAAGGVAFRIAPERVLLHLASPESWRAVAEEIDAAATPVLDLSHSRTRIVITGADAAALLARLLPIDFDEAAFPPGHFVQSAIHGAGVLVHRHAARFEVFVPRSFAVAIWEVMAESAAPFGYRID
jgi:heterotetrameric sarcosine oxidase gamma subunit